MESVSNNEGTSSRLVALHLLPRFVYNPSAHAVRPDVSIYSLSSISTAALTLSAASSSWFAAGGGAKLYEEIRDARR